jgi:hypothetical protein
MKEECPDISRVAVNETTLFCVCVSVGNSVIKKCSKKKKKRRNTAAAEHGIVGG